MAIDESAGVRDRKDRVLKSSTQSYAMAVMLRRGWCNYEGASLPGRTLDALARRGWAEVRPHPNARTPWATAWFLTEAGKAIAEGSLAVKEWIDGWKFYDNPPSSQPPEDAVAN